MGMANITAYGEFATPHPCEDGSLGTHPVCPFSAACDVETSGVGSCFNRATQWLTESLPAYGILPEGRASHWHMCGFHAGIAKRISGEVMEHLFPDDPNSDY